MRIVSHPEADEELSEAALWYERKQPGLGSAFLNEFERTIGRMVSNPKGWSQLKGSHRKLNLDRFPYAIVYKHKADELVVIAVMHHHRRPSYWRYRKD